LKDVYPNGVPTYFKDNINTMLGFVVKKNQIVWTKRFFAHNVKAGLDLYDLYLSLL